MKGSRSIFGPADLANQETETKQRIVGGASSDYDTLKEIEEKIKEIEAVTGNSAKVNGVTLTGELDSQSNLKIAGKVVAGTVYQIDGEDVTAANGG